ncbi:hypothetical protein YC2023_011570 [Brassica napus]|uniref:Uncharacterized protein n=1 Tax=Brassica oleracea TaxID=3712 RepID=A0A3P6FS12_BRAOL|nr:unnamed protein product [Brassica oleracea]
MLKKCIIRSTIMVRLSVLRLHLNRYSRGKPGSQLLLTTQRCFIRGKLVGLME